MKFSAENFKATTARGGHGFFYAQPYRRGLNKGVLDDWLMGMAQSSTGRAALKYAVNALGEGAEEFLGEMADAYLAKMWNDDERGFGQTMGEMLPDAFYKGLIGVLTESIKTCLTILPN